MGVTPERSPASDRAHLLKQLPGVDELLRSFELQALITRYGRELVAGAVRALLDTLRLEISSGRTERAGLEAALTNLPGSIERELQQACEPSLEPVINATGVILHTNLGRAPLSKDALEHARATATVYCNLEFNLHAGERGKRDLHAQRLFQRLLAARGDVSTIVVNNNAAAILLALNTLAEGGEVIVSRGELVEIGGSFRVPEIMAKSGAALREVGTTNRTRIADYERARSDRTRLLLRVHRSNFQITGFTEQPSLGELVALGRAHGVPVMEDLGSGALWDLRAIGIRSLGSNDEPTIASSLAAGVDLVTYSGDKLLGGPQAGMLTGRQDLIARCRANPLFRALRADKLTYAALESTLLAYLRQDYDAIPALAMMRLSADEIGRRASALRDSLAGSSLEIELVQGESVIGGGSVPGGGLPTVLLAIRVPGLAPGEVAAQLRSRSLPSNSHSKSLPIIVRVESGRVVLDLRTVFPDQDAIIEQALRQHAHPK